MKPVDWDLETLEDRAASCLVGQALGDAIGFPVEGMGPDAAAAHLARIQNKVMPTRAPYWEGQYTDDTQLARELARSLVERGDFDPADFARRVAELFTSGAVVGRGRATAAAAERIAAGVPWDRAGTPAPSAGNGSAMRAAPVGIRYLRDLDRLVEVAVDQGRVTHTDPRASAGAVAVAAGVALALRPEPVDPAAFVAEVADLVRRVHAPFATWLSEVPDLLGLSTDEALARVRALGRSEGLDRDWPGISPYVVPSVIWAFYAFLRDPEDYLVVVHTAVSPGGDVDTTAAMAGAMAGARSGMEALPCGARRVHDQGGWNHHALAKLGRQLARAALA